MRDEGGTATDLRARTKRFSLDVIALFVRLPRADVAMVMGRQLLRSATSVGAHYREACRARSDAEFISKMEGGLQELDESAYWLELLCESRVSADPAIPLLLAECDQLIRIFVTIVRQRKSR